MKQGGSRHDASVLRKVAAGLCVTLLVGCITAQQSYVTDVNPAVWSTTATVEVPNADTLGLRGLEIVIRSNQSLNTDTLTLRIATLSPDSVRFEESFQLRIPRIHKAAALHREAEITYRTQVVLSDSGLYRFSFTPTRPVRGIEAVGIHLANDR